MADVATLSVLLQARDKLSGPLGTMQGKLDQVSAKAKKMGMAMTALGGIITGAAVLSIKNFASMGDEIQKMALRTGFGTEALSEWAHAVRISGSDIKAFEAGIKRMASFVLDARDGLSTSTDALDRLGVSVKQLEGLSPEKTFEVLSSAIAAVPGDLERAALAQDVFGRAGTRLLPLLNEGEKGIAALRKEAHELGIVFDQEAANKAAQLSDTMTRLKSSITGVSITIGGVLAPILERAVKGITSVIMKVREWTKEHPQLTKFIAIGTAALGALMLVLGPLLIILPSLIAGIAAFGGAFTVALGPVGLIAAAIAGLIVIATKMGADWGAVWNGVRSVIEEVAFVIKNGIQGIIDIAGTLSTAFAFLPGLGNLFSDTTDRVRELGIAAALTTEQLAKLNVAQLEQELMRLRAAWQEVRLELDGQNAALDSFIGMISLSATATDKFKEKLNELEADEREVQDALTRLRLEVENVTPKLGEAGTAANLFRDGLGGIPEMADQAGRSVALMAEQMESAFVIRPLGFKTLAEQLTDDLAAAMKEWQDISDAADEKAVASKKRAFDDILALVQLYNAVQKILRDNDLAAMAQDIDDKKKLERDFSDLRVKLGQETFDKLTRGQLQFYANWDAVRASDQERLERTLAQANQNFDDMTDNLLFNFSEQGQAWKDLGGSAQGVLNAMVRTMGGAAENIIANLVSMRLEGETWKELFLRLDTEGTLNLANLAEAVQRLKDGMKDATATAREMERAIARFQIAEKAKGNVSKGPSGLEQAGFLAQQIVAAESVGMDASGLRTALDLQTASIQGLPLPTAAGVTPLRPGGGGGVLSVTVNVQGDVIGMDDLDDHITRTVRDASLKGGFVGTPLVK